MSYLQVKGDIVTRPERILIKEQTERVCELFGSAVLRIVNIGVGPGATLHCLQAGAPEAYIAGIDIVQRRLNPDAGHVLHVDLLLGDSHDPELQARFEPPIHVLLIDGDHHRKSVTEDINGWTPKIPPYGIVIFHDYKPWQRFIESHPSVLGVRQAVDEWKGQLGWDRTWREVERADSVIVFARRK